MMVKVRCQICQKMVSLPYYLQQGQIRSRIVCRDHINAPCSFNITETIEIKAHGPLE